MKLSILDAAKVIYEARRALQPFGAVLDDAGHELDLKVLPTFEELTSEQREPLLAEVQANRAAGITMNDALGQAIEGALK